MARSQWHRFYVSTIAAPPELLFKLLSDLPNYPAWLPGSGQYGGTTDVEPYPVQRGSRYRDGKPDERGKDWWGTVTGFQPTGSVDFHHTIHVKQLRATIDTHIHYPLAGPRPRDACRFPAAATADHPQLRQGERPDDGRAEGVRRGQGRKIMGR